MLRECWEWIKSPRESIIRPPQKINKWLWWSGYLEWDEILRRIEIMVRVAWLVCSSSRSTNIFNSEGPYKLSSQKERRCKVQHLRSMHSYNSQMSFQDILYEFSPYDFSVAVTKQLSHSHKDRRKLLDTCQEEEN